MTFSSTARSYKVKKRMEKESENSCFMVVSDRNNTVNKKNASKLCIRPLIHKGNTPI